MRAVEARALGHHHPPVCITAGLGNIPAPDAGWSGDAPKHSSTTSQCVLKAVGGEGGTLQPSPATPSLAATSPARAVCQYSPCSQGDMPEFSQQHSFSTLAMTDLLQESTQLHFTTGCAAQCAKTLLPKYPGPKPPPVCTVHQFHPLSNSSRCFRIW